MAAPTATSGRSSAVLERLERLLAGRGALASMIAAGFLLRLWLILDLRAGERFLLLVPDDSFYYFEIARNVVEGYGSTFDRLAPTNGYHPLWLVLLLPVFGLFAAPLPPVLFAMGLGALLWTLGAVFVDCLARRFSMAPGARALFVLLYLVEPYAVALSINGLETSLVVFLHLGFLAWIARALERPAPRPPRFYAIYGLLCALLFLARTDSALFIALVTLTLVFTAGERPGRPRRVELASWASATAVGLLVASPWIAWNLSTFGELVQSSGKALSLIEHRYAREVELRSAGGMLRRSAHELLGAFRDWWRIAGVSSNAVSVGVAWALTAVVLARALARRDPAPRLRWLLAAAAISTLALIVLHAALRWSVRTWYYALPIVLSFAVLAAVAQRLAGRAMPLVLALAAVLTVARNLDFWRREGLYRAQVGSWAGSLSHDAQLDPGTLLGSTDAGISGYLFERGQVVNLDGLVNSRVLSYYARGELVEYLREVGIRYAYLRPPYLHPIFTGPAALHLVGAEPYGAAQLYQVLTPEELLSLPLPEEPLPLADPRARRHLGAGWESEKPGEQQDWRAFSGPRAELFLPLRADRRYELELELRAEGDAPARSLRVLVNGHGVRRSPLAAERTTWRIELGPAHLVDGPNVVTLEDLRGGAPASIREAKAAPVLVHEFTIRALE